MYTRFDDFRQATSQRLCDTLDALAFDGREASRLVNDTFSKIEAVLCATGMSRFDAELRLAAIRHELEDRICNLMRGTLDLETTKNLIRIHRGED